MKVFLTLSLILIFYSVNAQVQIGEWREHLPYNNGQFVEVTEDRIYCATDLALFYIDKYDNSINRLSKINKLSDLEVGAIAYSKKYNKLIIGYDNGNIDILEGDKKSNFPDIKMKNIIADKTIYNILVDGDNAYLSTGFGIVVFNLEKNEFADTYIIGEGGSYMKINSVAIYENEIFALTDNGLLKADMDDPFLGNYQNWEKDTTVMNPDKRFYTSTVCSDRLYTVSQVGDIDSCLINTFDGTKWDTVFTHLNRIKSISSQGDYLTIVSKWHVDVYYNSERIVHFSEFEAVRAQFVDNQLWIADKKNGLVMHSDEIWKKIYHPNGPKDKNVFNIYYNNGSMLIAPGGYKSTGETVYNHADVYKFSGEEWTALTDDKENSDTLSLMRAVVGFTSQNSPDSYVAYTWLYGLFTVEDNKIRKRYNYENTNGILMDYVSGAVYDKYGNLHVMCRYSNYPFVVKTPEGKWYHYNYGNILSNKFTGKVINTNSGDNWVITPKGDGMVVWNDNDTPENGSDDVYRKFKLTDNSGKLINNFLYDIVQDNEGTIWIGTADGIAVYDYPQYAIDNDSRFYARVPQIVVDGYYESLLKGEKVTSIAIDGANRKWIGTEGGGLFLVSADGTEQLQIFNTDNSKLFSNNIVSVNINQKTGEVFIGTDKGIQSYQSTSTESKSNYSDIYAFPNPVEGDYNGIITIRGLMYQTNVKITDMSGHLVYETMSNGGDAVWNGKDMTGNKVAPGIYLVFCATPDGVSSEVTKILFVK